MVNIYLDNYDKKHETYELAKVLMETNDVNFLDNLDTFVDGYLIVIRVNENSVSSQIYLDKLLKSEYKIDDIGNINIKRPFRNKINIAMKKSLYKAVEGIKKLDLPWGILTGIRPSKIVHYLREQDVSEDEIIGILIEEYMIDINKAKLLLEITSRQERHIYPLDEDKYNLYISIPFCPSKCVYCSFPSYQTDRWKFLIDDYTEALIQEIKEMASFMSSKRLNTIYIGGGTPTAIPIKNLEAIIKAIYKYFDISTVSEFTVEAGRVDTINREVLEMLKRNDVGRISINPQTMSESTLELMNRTHGKKEVIEVYNLAKSMDFDSINMDLIIGLPEEDESDVQNTMDIIEILDPDNLTVHTLTIKKTSKLDRDFKKYDLKNANRLKEMLDISKEYANKMDMNPYYIYRHKQILGNFENIGYAKLGKECIYNIVMMEEKQTVLGLGAGAVSKIFYPHTNKIKRIPNLVGLKDYIERIDEMSQRKIEVLDK